MINRQLQQEANFLLSHFPCLGLIGPRQVGKTTMEKMLMQQLSKTCIYLDLESTSDFQKLENAETFFDDNMDKCLIIDEVQRRKELFPLIRSSIDKDRKPARFILLGSASPELIRESSESLAGRIAYLEIAGLNLTEISNKYTTPDLWFYGGFPEPFLNHAINTHWKNNFIKTYIERDLPQLGFPAKPLTTRRLWYMLAHYHGQLINYSDLSKSLELSSKTLKSYVEFLESAYLIRLLPSFHYNSKKRLVKSPKVYIRDSGILHHLLGIETNEQLLTHPKFGASWEGFIIEQIAQAKKEQQELFFYRTQHGAELDVVITENMIPKYGIEIKYGDQIKLSRGNFESAQSLEVNRKIVIHHKNDAWKMNNGFEVMGLRSFLDELKI